LYEKYYESSKKGLDDFNRTTKQVESLQQDLTNAKVKCVAYTAEIAELKARIADSDNATDAAELIQVSEMYNALKQTAEENERVLRDEIQSLNRSVRVSLSNRALTRDRKKYYKSKLRDEVESHKLEMERVLSEQFTNITKSIENHITRLKQESATE
jgi:predicted  nucleic acid-binding Zn-ribbon protein